MRNLTRRTLADRHALMAALTVTLMASCAAPRVASPGVGDVPFAPIPHAAVETPTPQEVVENTEYRRTGYLTLAGGVTFQGVETNVGGGGGTDTDSITLNGNLGFGFYVLDWLDLGLSDNIFWTETDSGGTTTTNLANNINVFANVSIIGNARSSVAFYVGPNFGLYLSETESGGNSFDSEETSFGFQAGVRAYLSRRAAFKAELRTIFSEQDFGVGVTSDVDQTSVLFGVDFSF